MSFTNQSLKEKELFPEGMEYLNRSYSVPPCPVLEDFLWLCF